MSKSNAGRIGVWGASGSGKSTLAVDLVRSVKRLVVFDPEEEFSQTLRNVKVVRSADEVRKAMRANWQGFRICFVPNHGQVVREMNRVSGLVFAAQEPYAFSTNPAHRLTFLVDELQMTFPVHGGAENCRNFGEICSRGRKRQIHVIGVSQRVSGVSTLFRGNLSDQIFMRAEELIDIKKIRDVCHLSLEEAKAMKNYQFVHKAGPLVSKGKTAKSGKMIYSS